METIFIKSCASLAGQLDKQRRYALITDNIIEKLHGKALEKDLKKKDIDVTLIVMPAGELYKTRETKWAIENVMLALKMDRMSGVIALGGGVVTDLAGFVAATYCRGIPWVCVPTTLLGMVDASIGGKTGVDVPEGKNLIGSFYPAELVLIDTDFLKTLPERELINGYAEIIKYGLIASKPLLKLIKKKGNFKEIIRRCILIKKKIVEKDPTEKGLRRILNFGHTIGHAIETVLKFQVSHGEAVGAGMLFESYLSGIKEFKEIELLLKDYRMKLPPLEKLMNAMKLDKKAMQGKPRFVLLEKIGKAAAFNGDYCTPVDIKKLKEAYEYFSH